MTERLTQDEIERLEVHANYLDRQARRDLASILRKAVDLHKALGKYEATVSTPGPGWAACKGGFIP